MPLSSGLSIHDDTQHKGSAKRAIASGVAPLDSSVEIPLINLKTGGANKLSLLNSNVELTDVDVMIEKYLSITMAVT